MPTYGYKCRECDNDFDVLQKISDPPARECPACGGPVKRVFHPVGIIFKGSGFYTTDYKRQSGPEKAAGGKNKDEGGKSEDADSKKTDAQVKKPEPEKAAT